MFLFFRVKNVPAGHKSAAYAFTYRHPERTLTEAEVNTAHERLVEQLKTQLNATIRA
jgi:phenylalanyl-tRNA synthetase beta chain